MKEISSKINCWCEAHEAEELEFLKTLAAIPAPSNHEEKRAEYLLDRLKALGVSDAYIDEALNVVFPMGEPGEEGYCVFMAHTDVVFPDTDELPVREENGRLYAPGVGDDTANAAGLFMCIKYILENRMTPVHPVLFVFNSGEEGLGNLKGVRKICENYRGKIKQLISFDGCYTDIVNGAVGSERWRVSAKTVGGHSYGAFGNPNAIAALAEVITKLYAQNVPRVPGTKTTYNVGLITGGTSVNTIAQSAEMLYEYRSDHKPGLEIMRDQFNAVLAEANCVNAQFEKELLGERPCSDIQDRAAEDALLETCKDVIIRVTGKEPPMHSASTDANIPLSLGIPSATFGLYIGEMAHTREENLAIDSLLPGLKICLTLITESCF